MEPSVHLIGEDLQQEAAEEAEDIRVVDEIESRVAAGEEQVREWAAFERELDEPISKRDRRRE
ncbi:MAG TPA: hypothetical protein VER55_05360 [Ardenticatenaceae bacterium]|nr:hypothetical protein [Ardenticatenaceae bacterium]